MKGKITKKLEATWTDTEDYRFLEMQLQHKKLDNNDSPFYLELQDYLSEIREQYIFVLRTSNFRGPTSGL